MLFIHACMDYDSQNAADKYRDAQNINTIFQRVHFWPNTFHVVLNTLTHFSLISVSFYKMIESKYSSIYNFENQKRLQIVLLAVSKRF